MRAFVAIVVIIATFVGAGALAISSGRKAVRTKHIDYVLEFIKSNSESPVIQQSLGGRMPRTEKEFCEAYFKTFQKSGSQTPPASLREIYVEAQHVEVEWTPESATTLARAREGVTVFSIVIEEQKLKRTASE